MIRPRGSFRPAARDGPHCGLRQHRRRQETLRWFRPRSSAGVSPKTIEATFGTKGRLLDAAVDFAIRGDTGAIEMPQRAPVIEMEQAADAPTMLTLHAAHLRRIHQRSARIAATVEQAAADPTVAEIWQRMNHNRAYAVRWAARTLLAKPGHRPGLTPKDTQTAFWITIDWGTYRTLTTQGASPQLTTNGGSGATTNSNSSTHHQPTRLRPDNAPAAARSRHRARDPAPLR